MENYGYSFFSIGLPEDGGEAESEGTCGGASDYQARMNEVARRQTHSYTVNLNNTLLGPSPCLDEGQELPPKYIFWVFGFTCPKAPLILLALHATLAKSKVLIKFLTGLSIVQQILIDAFN